jgi:hypothetical protein
VCAVEAPTVTGMNGTLVSLIATATVVLAGVGGYEHLIPAAEQAAGDTAVTAVVREARATALVSGTGWADQLALSGAAVVDGTIEIDGTVVRWNGPDVCRQANVPDVWSPVTVTDCEGGL